MTPTSVAPTDWMLRPPVGTASSSACGSTCCVTACCTSTTGDAPDTVTVSSSAPTRSSALTGAVKFAGSSTPSRFTVENPGSVKVTVYVPGRRSRILYCPCESVTADRVCSISAGLATSTVTPGITAPVVSLTTPAIALCARAAFGTRRTKRNAPTNTRRTDRPIAISPS